MLRRPPQHRRAGAAIERRGVAGLRGIAILVCLVGSLAFAAPAPWYKWKSTLDGKIACFQVSPGVGWLKDSGPYDDARCQLPNASRYSSASGAR